MLSFQSATECYVVTKNGVPFVMFGIQHSEHPHLACVWLVSTNEILHHAVKLVRWSREILNRWNEERHLLFNFVHEDNTLHLRWLQRVGFRLGNVAIKGDGERFIQVTRNVY